MADTVIQLNRQAADRVVRQPAPADIDPRRFRRRERKLEQLIAIATPALMLLAWELAADFRIIDIRYFPAPSVIFAAWWEMLLNGQFIRHLNASLSRIIQGFVYGAGVGLLFGVLLGSVKMIRRGFEPVLVGLNTIPKLSVLPLLLLLFGIGETTKILVVALSVVFVVLLGTMYSVATVSETYRETARFYGANRWQVLFHVDLPAALPHIFTSLRLGATIAVMVIVGAEFVAATDGLGFMVWNSWNLGLPINMYIGIIAMALLGVAAVALLEVIYRIATPWQR